MLTGSPGTTAFELKGLLIVRLKMLLKTSSLIKTICKCLNLQAIFARIPGTSCLEDDKTSDKQQHITHD